MQKYNNIKIPSELLISRSYDYENVNILIGENGSGKSSLLNMLAKYYMKNDYDVIAIANTIYDKFNIRQNKNFKSLKASRGKSLPNNIIKSALQNIIEDDFFNLRNIARTLSYINFDPIIILEVKTTDNKEDYAHRIIESKFSDTAKEEMLMFLEEPMRNLENYQNNFFHISLNYDDFNSLRAADLLYILKYENELKLLDIIYDINIFLQRDNQEIKLTKASSGELTLASTLIYITSIINEMSVILIDEPENSLHPQWQKDYIKMLLDLFYRYNPIIVLATHSPLIVNGGEVASENVKIFKSNNFTYKLQNKEPLNVEEIYYRFFNIATPENRFLSEQIIRLFNVLTAKKISLKDFKTKIDQIKNQAYDDKQINALEAVKKLAEKIN